MCKWRARAAVNGGFFDPPTGSAKLTEVLVYSSKVKPFVCFSEWKRGAAGEVVERMVGLLRD